MGYEMPVFFMPIDREKTVGVVSWTSAEELIGNAHENRVTTGLRSATSRNWWHLENAKKCAQKYDSEALQFLDAEATCLDTSQIVKAIHVLTEILAEASHGMDRMSTTCTAEANDFFLHKELAARGVEAATKEALSIAFREAQPKQDVGVTSDAGYSACVDFFSFLKTLLSSLVESLIQGKSFLFARPQP